MHLRDFKKPPLPNTSSRAFATLPYALAGVYALASALWIFYSDRILEALVADHEAYRQFQTYKGTFFIVLSSLILLVCLRWACNRALHSYGDALRSERRLQAALTAADGGIWELSIGEDQDTLDYVSPGLRTLFGIPTTRPLNPRELRERTHPEDLDKIENALDQVVASQGRKGYDMRYRVRAEDGGYRWLHARGSLQFDEQGGGKRIVGVTFDVTEKVEAEERVRQLLRYDPATGLPKHNKFVTELQMLVQQVRQGECLGVAQIKLLDIEHLVGDSETSEDAQIIRTIGDRLRMNLPTGFLASRLSTDVFVIAVPPLPAAESMDALVHIVNETFGEPLGTDERPLRLRFQAGGVLSSSAETPAQVLLRNCGHALERADRSAEGGIRWFTEGLDAELRARHERLLALEDAPARGEIECHFQPLVALATGRTAGFEALARWRRADGEMVPPSEFIPLAEEFGHISAIGEEILLQACRAAAGWECRNGRAPFVAVNVSPLQIEDAAFPTLVARVLAQTGLNPTRLELEITETALMRQPEVAAARLTALRKLGVSIAMDDFGTGYSSLSLLSRLPFNRLKIDRAFIADYGERQDSTGIADTIIDLCRHMRLQITAEGVETAAQARRLAQRGVPVVQGYLFSRPVPAAEAAAMIDRQWPVEDCPQQARRHAAVG